LFQDFRLLAHHESQRSFYGSIARTAFAMN